MYMKLERKSMIMNGEKKDIGKEYRRYLYQNNKEEYKKERSKNIRGISKTFRNLRKDKKEEMDFLEEQTILSNKPEENGVEE